MKQKLEITFEWLTQNSMDQDHAKEISHCPLKSLDRVQLRL